MQQFKLSNKNKAYIFLFALTLMICGVVTRLPIAFFVVSIPILLFALFSKGAIVSVEKSKLIIDEKLVFPFNSIAMLCYISKEHKSEIEDDPTALEGNESLVQSFRIDNYKDDSYFFVGQKYGNKEELLTFLLKKMPPSRIEIKYYSETSALFGESFVMENNTKERYKV
ncbi:hypothetical protein R9C00_01545 [Flammeovirgaceae bacterium SG7u.111]|nr:hypothetical protein [Flammeovirgaceae bacterium SG7u.132]WPO36125.1 hypothetical protein R9C00_01545 [Flammeovirgaceae bacterium SG7u.111]